MIARILDDAHVAQKTLRRQQAHFLVQDGAKELVRGAETLHEDIALAVVNHADGFGHSLQFVLDVNDGEFFDIDLGGLADLGNHIGITYQGHFHKTHVAGQGGSLDGVGIDAPGGNHSFANAFGFELGKKLVEIADHNLILDFLILNAWYRGQSPAPRWCR